jgi:hypothetical protein
MFLPTIDFFLQISTTNHPLARDMIPKKRVSSYNYMNPYISLPHDPHNPRKGIPLKFSQTLKPSLFPLWLHYNWCDMNISTGESMDFNY